MEHVKYVCPECGHESEDAGFCPDCEVALVASCPVCGNPIVGEQVELVDS